MQPYPKHVRPADSYPAMLPWMTALSAIGSLAASMFAAVLLLFILPIANAVDVEGGSGLVSNFAVLVSLGLVCALVAGFTALMLLPRINRRAEPPKVLANTFMVAAIAQAAIVGLVALASFALYGFGAAWSSGGSGGVPLTENVKLIALLVLPIAFGAVPQLIVAITLSRMNTPRY